MERHRCTKCRNPIRNLSVSRPGAGENTWYHPDCWAALCSSEQERYEKQVRDTGLSALLAPYVHVAPAEAAQRTTVESIEQPQS
ncbi:MAG TPA: hypothetical protein VK204_08075 [Nocardioidaceae bacterium]|jgi:hypothetical protein|nr:hypothetical protein [Nocardioidaceae bacterium]